MYKTDTAESFGALVRRYREQSGWTRKELARRVSCAAVTIQKVERGERRPSVELARLLAAAFALAPGQAAALRAAARSQAGPAQPEGDPIIGRDEDLGRIRGLALGEGRRLITLVGPGGVGKTRLARAALAELSGSFADGAALAELDTLADVDLLPDAIAQAVGCPAPGDRPTLAALIDHLAPRHTLLCLDNFEQLAAGAAPLGPLVAACPGLTLLITSREPLRLEGEAVLPVEPLALPADVVGRGQAAEAIAAAPAVALFVARARSAQPGFALADENAGAVARLCALLDGLPLAIELVAARSRLMSPQALLDRLSADDDRPRIGLLARAPDAAEGHPERQRTLRDALDWSYRLLTPEERAAFRQLGVLQGGGDLGAAEALLAAGPEDDDASLRAWDLLSSLLDKSLLTRRESGGEPRFGMLETVRAYARERLAEAGEEERARGRHARHYCAVAQRLSEKIMAGEEAESWLRVADGELANMRAAIGWALGRGDGELAVRAATALRRYMWIRCRWQEGRAWLERGLAIFAPATAEQAAARALGLRALGSLSLVLGERDAARAQLEQSIGLARSIGDEYVESLALSSLATLLCNEGELDRAEELMLQSMAYDRKSGNRRDLAISYGILGEIAFFQGDHRKAEGHLREALGIHRAVGDSHSAMLTSINLGEALLRQGSHDEARRRLAEGLALARSLSNRLAEASALRNLAELGFAAGHTAEGFGTLAEALALAADGGLHLAASGLLALAGAELLARGAAAEGLGLLGAAPALAAAHGVELVASDQEQIERALAAARAAHGEAAAERAYLAGAARPAAESLALAIRLCEREGQRGRARPEKPS